MDEQTIDIDPQEVTVTPQEYRLALTLKPKRLLRGAPDTQEHLRRVGVYLARRLQRTYPQLGVSRPVMSVDVNILRHVYISFGWVDLGPYIEDDRPRLLVLSDAHKDVTFLPNRAARRAV